jgi:hypothetical protein
MIKITIMRKEEFENDINPKNILLKLNWASSIEILNDKEKSSILTNIFRYHTGNDLVPMSKAANMFFSGARDVFDYNIEKYQQKVQDNRINGRKGGRPKIKNPNNPDGYFKNPENPKEKDIDIFKDKGIDSNKLMDNTSTSININEKNKSNRNIEFTNNNNGFKKIYEIEFDQLTEYDDKVFCANVKELVDRVGWEQFFYLISGTEINDAVEQLDKLGFDKLESSLINIRKHHNYFLNKLVK